MSQLIKMRRNDPQHEGGPVTADVHPDSVGEFLHADWEIEMTETAESPSPSEPQRRGGRRKQTEASEASAEQAS